ncbi:sugar kinase [Arthrobacter tecti]
MTSTPDLHVVTLGETLGLLRADTPGPLAHVSEMTLGIGGAESNVAIALQRLGMSTSWIGRVGRDSLGERILRELRAEGVNAHAIIDEDAPTGLMLKERRTADSVRVWYYREGSAGSRLTPETLPLAAIRDARLLHITGITPALSDSAYRAVFAAIHAARAAGVPVSFDVNHRSSLWKGRNPASVYIEMAKASTIVFAGEDEARLIVPLAESVADLGHGIAALGPSDVVIKQGAAGCFALIDGTEYHQDAVDVRAVDTVGAGDAFVAGYLFEFLTGKPIHQRLSTAVKTGAFACLTTGDWEGSPRQDELTLLDEPDPVTR